MEIGNPQIVKTALGPVEYLEEGEGPAVLCIHGAMGGYDQSITLGRTIGQSGYRYIGISRPGFLGTPIRCGRTAEQQARLYEAFLDALEIDRVIIMAISGGGPSAVHFALRYPERCDKLVLCSTVGSAAKQNVPLSFYLMMFMAKFAPITRSMKKKTASDLRSAAGRSITNPDLLDSVMRDPEVLDLFNVVLLGSFDNMGKRCTGTRYDIRNTETFRCDLENISVPTLIVHGDKDPMVPFEKHGKVLATKIPGARLCLAKGGEHPSIFTHREQVREAVKAFLE